VPLDGSPGAPSSQPSALAPTLAPRKTVLPSSLPPDEKLARALEAAHVHPRAFEAYGTGGGGDDDDDDDDDDKPIAFISAGSDRGACTRARVPAARGGGREGPPETQAGGAQAGAHAGQRGGWFAGFRRNRQRDGGDGGDRGRSEGGDPNYSRDRDDRDDYDRDGGGGGGGAGGGGGGEPVSLKEYYAQQRRQRAQQKRAGGSGPAGLAVGSDGFVVAPPKDGRKKGPLRPAGAAAGPGATPAPVDWSGY